MKKTIHIRSSIKANKKYINLGVQRKHLPAMLSLTSQMRKTPHWIPNMSPTDSAWLARWNRILLWRLQGIFQCRLMCLFSPFWKGTPQRQRQANKCLWSLNTPLPSRIPNLNPLETHFRHKSIGSCCGKLLGNFYATKSRPGKFLLVTTVSCRFSNMHVAFFLTWQWNLQWARHNF